MTEQDRIEASAYAEAATKVLKFYHDFGQETAAAMTRGITEAFVNAYATYHGWPATFEMVRRCAAEKHSPPKGERLQLVVSNEAFVSKLSGVPHAS